MISTSCFGCQLLLTNRLLCSCPEKLGTTEVKGDSLTCYGELLPLILIAWWELDLHSAFILALSKIHRLFFLQNNKRAKVYLLIWKPSASDLESCICTFYRLKIILYIKKIE